jgi:hypothetical protein
VEEEEKLIMPQATDDDCGAVVMKSATSRNV